MATHIYNYHLFSLVSVQIRAIDIIVSINDFRTLCTRARKAAAVRLKYACAPATAHVNPSWGHAERPCSSFLRLVVPPVDIGLFTMINEDGGRDTGPVLCALLPSHAPKCLDQIINTILSNKNS